MSDLGVQMQLPRAPMALDEEMIRRPSNLLAAFVLQAGLGGLEDKQAAAAAGMDPATWSRFKQGDVGIKPANLITYREQCGNDLALARWAYECGYVLTLRETEVERRLRLEREENDELKKENALLRNLLVGKAA